MLYILKYKINKWQIPGSSRYVYIYNQYRGNITSLVKQYTIECVHFICNYLISKYINLVH